MAATEVLITGRGSGARTVVRGLGFCSHVTEGEFILCGLEEGHGLTL